ncbi:MAG TPA: alpha/beta hydrolase-fold protein [Anaerolineae bacterium]
MEHELISRARQTGAPLLDAETATATFVWKGRTQPILVGDFNDWCSPDAASPHGPVYLNEVDSGVWSVTLPFPPDAYIEYAYSLNGKSQPDPLNPQIVSNGLGDDNSFFYMPQAAPTPLTRRRRTTPHGTVTRHVIDAGDVIVSGKRTVYLYQPPVREPCPLLTVLDGPEYLHRAKLPVIVDNMIAAGRIRPIALAMVDNSPVARLIEYACSDASVSFLVDHIVPFAQAHLNLIDHHYQPGIHGLMGASMGGAMALYGACRVPEAYGHVLSQSGAFHVLNRDLVVYDLLRHGSVKPVHIWMDVGRYESLLDCNRRMNQLLTSRGYDATYRELNSGHNYPAWRDDLWRGLEALYGADR